MPHFFAPCRSFAAVLAVLACALVSPLAQAERADRDKPMNAEADALRYDDVRQTSVFTGNVVITKGSILIRGAQVEVLQNSQGHQLGTVLAAADKLAYFRQKRDGVNEFIEGEARRIDYDSQADVVKFSGQAVIRRYRGATLSDETSGGLIVYDNKTDVFTVDGGPSSKSSTNPSGRVRTMLTPKPKTDLPSAFTGGPVLQPSHQLESRP